MVLSTEIEFIVSISKFDLVADIFLKIKIALFSPCLKHIKTVSGALGKTSCV